jgi:cell division protein FtsQ
MWDNAPLLRTVSNLLIGLSVILVMIGATRYILQMDVFSLNSVRLSEAPKHVPTELIKSVVAEQIKGNFFTVDLNKTRTAFEHLPWVRKVSVRRKFPWSLEVDLEEQVALARWNGNELVNTYGEIFSDKTEQVLPAFFGQQNTSPQMTSLFGEFSKTLLPLKQQITQISLSPRFAWQLRLNNGIVLELGREHMQQRLERFVDVYPYSLSTLSQPVTHIDLRYQNGFAVYLPGGADIQDRHISGNKA